MYRGHNSAHVVTKKKKKRADKLKKFVSNAGRSRFVPVLRAYAGACVRGLAFLSGAKAVVSAFKDYGDGANFKKLLGAFASLSPPAGKAGGASLFC